VRLQDGRLTPIENLKPGDRVASIQVPGLEVDVPYRAQYNWLSHHGLHGATPVAARVSSIRLGEHHGFMVINRRLKATPEHPFMIRRGDEWGFASAEFVQPGDYLIDEHMNEEEVESVVRIDAPTRTVAIHIPGTNTLLAEGVWVHNDMPATAQSSGSGSASSGSGSGSGSWSASGSGSGSMSASSSGSSSSGSSSGSKSSGSSSFSTSGSMSGSSSSSGSGSGSVSGSSSSGGGTGTFSI
jgi:hypothetical protein